MTSPLPPGPQTTPMPSVISDDPDAITPADIADILNTIPPLLPPMGGEGTHAAPETVAEGATRDSGGDTPRSVRMGLLGELRAKEAQIARLRARVGQLTEANAMRAAINEQQAATIRELRQHVADLDAARSESNQRGDELLSRAIEIGDVVPVDPNQLTINLGEHASLTINVAPSSA